VPLDREGLERFDETVAAPEAVAAGERRWEMPRNEIADVKRALAGWTDSDG
jgi:hypothetical protein